MFGPFGGFEILVLMAIGLLVFGPRRMPEIGRSLGKAMLEFRKAATELRTSIEREINIEEMKETARSIRSDIETSVLAEPRATLTETTRSIKDDI
jgi:Tat protein translocase TatB subunit